MKIWADYSGGRPSGAALRSAGIFGVLRYVGIGTAGKRLNAAELADLRSAGLMVWGVVESTVDRSNGGYPAGQADARAVLADPVTATLPIVCATNDQPSYSAATVEYVRGFADVLGQARTGAYGYGPFLAAVHGVASTYWQAGHPPNMTRTQSFVHLWQRQGTAGNGSDGPATPTVRMIDGVICDLNNQLMEVTGTMTTLDDQERSFYVDPTGQQSTVTQALWRYILSSDSSGWFVRQMLDGEQRRHYPDGVSRNVVEALTDISARLARLETETSQEDVDLLTAIHAVDSVTLDSAAVSTALIAAGLPDQVAHALTQMISTRLAG